MRNVFTHVLQTGPYSPHIYSAVRGPPLKCVAKNLISQNPKKTAGSIPAGANFRIPGPKGDFPAEKVPQDGAMALLHISVPAILRYPHWGPPKRGAPGTPQCLFVPKRFPLCFPRETEKIPFDFVGFSQSDLHP